MENKCSNLGAKPPLVHFLILLRLLLVNLIVLLAQVHATSALVLQSRSHCLHGFPSLVRRKRANCFLFAPFNTTLHTLLHFTHFITLQHILTVFDLYRVVATFCDALEAHDTVGVVDSSVGVFHDIDADGAGFLAGLGFTASSWAFGSSTRNSEKTELAD